METAQLPLYNSWDNVPDGLKTKTQLLKLGLKPNKTQLPVALKKNWMDKYGDDYALYQMKEAVQKKEVTSKQKEALEKARQKSRENNTCQACGYRLRRDEYKICKECEFDQQVKADRIEAVEWAKKVLANPKTRILDTETTGLDTDAEIIEISIIDLQGKVIFRSLFRPTVEIEPGATAVHGYQASDLIDAPSVKDKYEPLISAIADSDPLVIFNAAFDLRLLQQTFQRYGLPVICPVIQTECAMLWLSQFAGQWSRYYNSYKWQSLSGSDHTATGDCRAALNIIKWMANQ